MRTLVSTILLFVIFFAADQALGQRRKNLLRNNDTNRDGRISREEFPGSENAFKFIDQNKDGYLTRQELKGAKQRREKMQQQATAKSGEPYQGLVIEVYQPDKVWEGNVIFHDSNEGKIIEMDLAGKIVWEYNLPEELGKICTTKSSCGTGNRITDVELLPNDNILFVLGGNGVYEINRSGKIVWSYQNETVSHDADRLPNGNTLIACANAEKKTDFPYQDPQVIEVDKKGTIVWSWSAKNHYLNSSYKDIRSKDANDWTHVNSVTRLADGTTMISTRNWQAVIIVAKSGKTVQEIKGPVIRCPHTPHLLTNGNLLVSEPLIGAVFEYNPGLEKVVWKYPQKPWKRGGKEYYFARGAQRLPNGNTFFVDSCGRLLEVTSDGEVVWQAKKSSYQQQDKPPQWHEITTVPFMKADRRGAEFYEGR